MLRALWAASSGMLSQQMSLDTISNNLANVNTTGYKKVRTEFHDLLYSEINRAGQIGVTPVQVGNGVRTAATVMIYDQGNLEMTDRNSDFAISGDAFFEVTLADGSKAYTRDGAFKVDVNGNLVTSAGYLVGIDGKQGDVKFTKGLEHYDVDTTGAIFEKQEAFKIDSYTFPAPGGLQQLEPGIFLTTDKSGEAGLIAEDTTGNAQQGTYFKILLPDGQTAYTNQLTFKVDDTGKLVTVGGGYSIDPPAQVPPDLFKTGDMVSADEKGVVVTPVEIGKITTKRFANPEGLEKVGFLFAPTSNSGLAQEAVDYSITRGALESSNVETTEEVTEMIIVQRAYDLNSRSVQTSDQMLGIANSLFRR